jgi:hypothetical protein
MEMHAIQSKQASMSSGCIVGLPTTRPLAPKCRRRNTHAYVRLADFVVWTRGSCAG